MEKEMKRYFAVGILAFLIFLSYKIISPFIIVLISSFILAYLAKPIYDKLRQKINYKISALLCVFITLLIILIPLVAIVSGIINQAKKAVLDQGFQIFVRNVLEIINLESLASYLPVLLDFITDGLVSLLSAVLAYLPSLFLTVIILIIAMYYFLIGWDDIVKELKNYLPSKNKNKTAKEISETTRAIVYGMLLVALIQFAVSAIGFYLIGISLYLLLPSLIFFLAFIPSIGPAFVWVPLAFYYVILGDWRIAIPLIIFGFVLSYFFDAFLRAKIVGKKANVNPLLMLIGILGGIYVFGIFGFIIGPLILIYTFKFLKEFLK